MRKIRRLLTLFIIIAMAFGVGPVTANAEWKSDSCGWWYNNADSYCIGWKKIDNEWYFFDNYGYMMTGWIKTDNKWYYMNENGTMVHDNTIGIYKLGSDGAMIEDSKSTSKMEKNYYKASDGTNLGYWLYSPENADNKKLPLIIYLHGYWGEDSDINKVIQNEGLPKDVYNKTIDVPAYVLCPYCDQRGGWAADEVVLKELIDNLVAKENIDSNKISLTGHSMGGVGVWLTAVMYPDLFSCIVPVSGLMNPDYIEQTNLKDIPVWAFVGDKDDTIDPQYSIDCVNKLKELGGDAKITIFKGAAHCDTAILTYRDKDSDVLNWMISQTKKQK